MTPRLAERSASVLVCTCGRDEWLARCLESILADRSEVPRDLIVVDNQPSESTRALVESMAVLRGDIPVRYAAEPTRGTSHARNRSVELATGDYLLFADDDVVVEDGWADALVNGFSDPRVGAVGGRILPRWPYPPPEWMNGSHAEIVTLRDFGTEARWFAPPDDIPLGANMAVRAECIKALSPPFDPELGHNGNVHMGSEESRMLERIAETHALAYVPHAVVHHNILPQRISWDWMRKAHFNIGIGLARKDRLDGAPSLPLPVRLVRAARTTRVAWATQRRTRRTASPTAADAGEEFLAFLWAGKHIEMLLGRFPRAVSLLGSRWRKSGSTAAHPSGPRTVVVSTFPPRRDGIARYAAQVTAGLVQRGHRTLSIGLPGSEADRVTRLDGWLRPLRLLRWTNSDDAIELMWHPEFFFSGRALSRIATHAALGAVWRLRPTRVVIHEQDAFDSHAQGVVRTCARSLEGKARLWCWQADATFALHSERERELFDRQQPHGGRTEIIDHAGFFQPFIRASRAEARTELGLDPRGTLLLCIGFFGHHKGFDRAVRAFAKLPQSAASLYVVGSKLYDTPEVRTYAASLKALIDVTQGAHLVERFVEDAEFDLWLQAADVVVLPYRSAASSGVAARARMLGTAVIAADVGALREQLGDAATIVATDAELAGALREFVARDLASAES